jgi:hypothetical protein
MLKQVVNIVTTNALNLSSTIFFAVVKYSVLTSQETLRLRNKAQPVNAVQKKIIALCRENRETG